MLDAGYWIIEEFIPSIQNQVSRIEYPLFGVDVCSGVRTNSILDEEKLKLFFDRVRSVNKLLAGEK